MSRPARGPGRLPRAGRFLVLAALCAGAWGCAQVTTRYPLSEAEVGDLRRDLAEITFPANAHVVEPFVPPGAIDCSDGIVFDCLDQASGEFYSARVFQWRLNDRWMLRIRDEHRRRGVLEYAEIVPAKGAAAADEAAPALPGGGPATPRGSQP